MSESKYKEVKRLLEKEYNIHFIKGKYSLLDVLKLAKYYNLVENNFDFNEETYKSFYKFKTIKTLIKDIPFLHKRK